MCYPDKIFGSDNETFFKNVYQFPKASYLKINLNKPLSLNFHNFWKLKIENNKKTFTQACKDINKLIKVQDSIFENFKNLVLKNRKKKIKPSQVFNGEFWTGEQAKTLGLVDSNEELSAYLSKTYGKNLKIRKIEGKKSFVKNLFGSSSQSNVLVDHLFERLNESSYWSKYGL